jgi:hypothetical protein
MVFIFLEITEPQSLSYTCLVIQEYNMTILFQPKTNFSFKNGRIYDVFRKSLCIYKRCWEWCPRASIQAWTNIILFANTFSTSACEMFLMYTVMRLFKLIKRACMIMIHCRFCCSSQIKVWWSKISISIAFSKDVFNKKNTFLNCKNHSE